MGLKNIQALQKEMKRLQSGGGGGGSDKYIRMPDSDGTVVVRVLPPLSGLVEDLYSWTRIHNVNGQRVQCPNELIDGERWFGDCPICAYGRYLWKQSEGKPKEEEEALTAEAGSIKANERYFYIAVVKSQTGQFRNGKANPLNTPLIWSIGKQLHEKYLTGLTGNEKYNEPSLGDVTAYDGEGRDFKIIKTTARGKNGKTYPDYDKSKFQDPSIAGPRELWEEWLKHMPDIKSERQPASIEDCKKEILYHRGVVKDPRQGFDISEYSGGNGPACGDEPPRRTVVRSGFGAPARLGGQGGQANDGLEEAAAPAPRQQAQQERYQPQQPPNHTRNAPAAVRTEVGDGVDTSVLEDEFLEGLDR